MFVKQCSIHGSRAKYIYGRKKQINYKFIPTSLMSGRPRNRLVGKLKQHFFIHLIW